MKLGEGGEAFFVFETTDTIPQSMQTSPLVSPASSPPLGPEQSTPGLQEPDLLELDDKADKLQRPPPTVIHARTINNGLCQDRSPLKNFANIFG